uniref:Uncharacterized protein n=1 Tax=Candidatus Kentrum eta TaxID=2126337 RepID=A0A450VKJ0_9GAMM|nr:MAG: hypothetical protein BECKH772B_GA0070898_102447 [Candidatus Kentron sp. H]VFK05336.1 MAG: hypothetical protein BECKH772C_GA0070978_102606 [Candidatus Kentron sp. H]
MARRLRVSRPSPRHTKDTESWREAGDFQRANVAVYYYIKIN